MRRPSLVGPPARSAHLSTRPVYRPWYKQYRRSYVHSGVHLRRHIGRHIDQGIPPTMVWEAYSPGYTSPSGSWEGSRASFNCLLGPERLVLRVLGGSFSPERLVLRVLGGYYWPTVKRVMGG